ncbi:MAG: nicotinamide riboside transporter PnuC [Fulvivirga sp.]|nr:nicotinamide riboside transporter PnuC [Fulvivirga sp.]
MESFFQEVSKYILQIDLLEFSGLVFGLLAVYFLIRENILTWPSGIAYVLVSFVIFWQQKLYADFALHIFFLVLNVYGWWYWVRGGKKTDQMDVPVSTTSPTVLILLLVLSVIGIAVTGYFLQNFTDAAVPYWDSATTVLSLTGMWLTARKKIENWYFWFVVDILATGIYFYKGIYFYATLYLIYIVLAIIGYLAWKKTMQEQVISERLP